MHHFKDKLLKSQDEFKKTNQCVLGPDGDEILAPTVIPGGGSAGGSQL